MKYKGKNASHLSWQKKNPEANRRNASACLKRRRIKALKIVGEGLLKCSRCGCDDVRILEINHKNRDGRKDLKEKSNHKFYLNIIKGIRKTDDLNILCKLCNTAHFIESEFNINYEIKLK